MIYPSISPSLHLSIHPSIHPSLHPSVRLSVCPSICLPARLSVCLPARLSVSRPIHLPFFRFFRSFLFFRLSFIFSFIFSSIYLQCSYLSFLFSIKFAVPFFTHRHQTFSNLSGPLEIALPDPAVFCRQRKGMSLAEATLILDFVGNSKLDLSAEKTGPQVPWVILYFEFCHRHPTTELAEKPKSLHLAVCTFRTRLTRTLKYGGYNPLVSPNCNHLRVFGLSKISGLRGRFDPHSRLACWYGVLLQSLRKASSHGISPNQFTWEPIPTD